MSNGVEVQRVFDVCDADGDGRISSSELRQFVTTATVGVQLSHEDVEAMVKTLNSDGEGFLSLEDFMALMEGSGGEEGKVQDLKEAFGVYAKDGSDCITPESLRRMLNRLGESRTIEECTVMIDHFDLNGDGELSFDEFKLMMLS